MSDRLQELLRQRALLSEHAAWLEREIALEQGTESQAAATPVESPSMPAEAPAENAESPAPPPPAAGVSPSPGPLTPLADAGAQTPDAILPEFPPEPKDIRKNVTRGCLLYFVTAFVLLGLGVVAIYWVYSHH